MGTSVQNAPGTTKEYAPIQSGEESNATSSACANAEINRGINSSVQVAIASNTLAAEDVPSTTAVDAAPFVAPLASFQPSRIASLSVAASANDAHDASFFIEHACATANAYPAPSAVYRQNKRKCRMLSAPTQLLTNGQ